MRRGEVPAALPDDADFGFSGDADRLARAYESGWTACRLIADRWGEERLGAFYRAVGAHRQREGAVEDAMARVLDTTPEEFTARWRDHVRDRLG
ncbi:Lipoprotein OS=Streptomyces griseomycini OX=66895 GN=FHS37_000380 PE=4 SV=1 [Streptomyces griseomycini]